MSKTVVQLTETTNIKGGDLLHIVDVTNNQDKKITVANFLNSKPYGELYTVTGGNTTIASAGTFYNITNGAAFVTNNGILNLFTHDNVTGKLTYVGDEDIIVDISAVVSLLGATTNSDIRLIIAINGSIVPKSVVAGYSNPNFFYGNYNPKCINQLSKNDYIQVYISNETGTDDMVIATINLSVKQI